MNNSKILIFSDWFYPGFKAGGPIKSALNLTIALQKEFDVFVFTRSNDLHESTPYKGVDFDKWTTLISEPKINVYYATDGAINLRLIKKMISSIKPDFIYLNHLWSPKFVLFPLAISRFFCPEVKVVLCPRGALFESALHYQNTFLKKWVVIRLLKMLGLHKKIIFHATTDLEANTIRKHFGKVDITIANNLPDFYQAPLSIIPKKIGQVKIVFISRIVAIKNLQFLLEQLVLCKKEIVLTIAGTVEDVAYWEQCKIIIGNLPKNVKANYIGQQSPENIEKVLKEHHLFCLPTKGENFGHSIFESFLAGRPVIISDKTPWLQLNNKKAGFDLSLDEEQAFANCIDKAANWDEEEFSNYCRGAWQLAHNYISNPELLIPYYSLFSKNS